MSWSNELMRKSMQQVITEQSDYEQLSPPSGAPGEEKRELPPLLLERILSRRKLCAPRLAAIAAHAPRGTASLSQLELGGESPLLSPRNSQSNSQLELNGSVTACRNSQLKLIEPQTTARCNSFLSPHNSQSISQLDLAEQQTARRNSQLELNGSVTARRNLQLDLAEQQTTHRKSQRELNDSISARRNSQLEFAGPVSPRRNSQLDLNDPVSARCNSQLDLNKPVSARRNSQLELAEQQTTRCKSQLELNNPISARRNSQLELNQPSTTRRNSVLSPCTSLSSSSQTTDPADQPYPAHTASLPPPSIKSSPQLDLDTDKLVKRRPSFLSPHSPLSPLQRSSSTSPGAFLSSPQLDLDVDQLERPGFSSPRARPSLDLATWDLPSLGGHSFSGHLQRPPVPGAPSAFKFPLPPESPRAEASSPCTSPRVSRLRQQTKQARPSLRCGVPSDLSSIDTAAESVFQLLVRDPVPSPLPRASSIDQHAPLSQSPPFSSSGSPKFGLSHPSVSRTSSTEQPHFSSVPSMVLPRQPSGGPPDSSVLSQPSWCSLDASFPNYQSAHRTQHHHRHHQHHHKQPHLQHHQQQQQQQLQQQQPRTSHAVPLAHSTSPALAAAPNTLPPPPHRIDTSTRTNNASPPQRPSTKATLSATAPNEACAQPMQSVFASAPMQSPINTIPGTQHGSRQASISGTPLGLHSFNSSSNRPGVLLQGETGPSSIDSITNSTGNFPSNTNNNTDTKSPSALPPVQGPSCPWVPPKPRLPYVPSLNLGALSARKKPDEGGEGVGGSCGTGTQKLGPLSPVLSLNLGALSSHKHEESVG